MPLGVLPVAWVASTPWWAYVAFCLVVLSVLVWDRWLTYRLDVQIIGKVSDHGSLSEAAEALRAARDGTPEQRTPETQTLGRLRAGTRSSSKAGQARS